MIEGASKMRSQPGPSAGDLAQSEGDLAQSGGRSRHLKEDLDARVAVDGVVTHAVLGAHVPVLAHVEAHEEATAIVEQPGLDTWPVRTAAGVVAAHEHRLGARPRQRARGLRVGALKPRRHRGETHEHGAPWWAWYRYGALDACEALAHARALRMRPTQRAHRIEEGRQPG